MTSWASALCRPGDDWDFPAGLGRSAAGSDTPEGPFTCAEPRAGGGPVSEAHIVDDSGCRTTVGRKIGGGDSESAARGSLGRITSMTVRRRRRTGGYRTGDVGTISADVHR